MNNQIKKSNFLSIPLTVAAVALVAGCMGSETTHPEMQRTVVHADVATLETSSVPVISVAPGVVVSERQVQVASRLMGYIRDLNVHEGQTVKAGQPLFTIDPTDIEGQVRQAQAGLAQAEVALVDAKADYERFSALYEDESIPKQQFDKIKLQYRVAQSQMTAAQAGLDTARSQLRYAEVRAPMDGVVVQKLAVAGDLAAPGRPIVVIENPSRLQVQTDVAAEVFERIKVGDHVETAVDGNATVLQGRIARIVSAADPMTHTYRVKIDLPPTTGLRSGAYARVNFTLGTRDGIRIPKSAVLQRAGITGTFVVDEQGVAHYRMIRTGAEADDHVEIQAGLSRGERVVVSGNGMLQSGDQVESTGDIHG